MCSEKHKKHAHQARGGVQSIAEKTQGEDCHGEGVARQARVSIEQPCKGSMTIFWRWKELDVALGVEAG